MATIVLTGACLTLPDAAPARSDATQVPAHASRAKQPTPAQKRRAELRRQALKKPTLTLDSRFIRKAQATGSVLPFTLRLRRPYEGGPGDDVLQLAWDPSATAWPLAGTAPTASPSIPNLDGAMSYEWDYGADTTGYSMLGTVETRMGAGISLTGSGFPIAVPETSTCTTVQSLDATGMSLTAAGMRFGTANPFSGEVNGTVNLRTTIRTKVVPCTGPLPAGSDTAVATTTSADPPLPVAFTGKFTVSPAVTGDGRVRFGVLRINDSPETPQRTTFGMVYVCTDPTAADGCDRKGFPVRTKLLSLTAEVLAGGQMPGPPPPPAPPAPPPASTTTPAAP